MVCWYFLPDGVFPVDRNVASVVLPTLRSPSRQIFLPLIFLARRYATGPPPRIITRTNQSGHKSPIGAISLIPPFKHEVVKHSVRVWRLTILDFPLPTQYGNLIRAGSNHAIS